MTSCANAVSRPERTAAILLLAVVFAFGLFDHSLWSSNDAREGAMIAEMFRTGAWVAPVFNGKAYLEKPPLLHWTALVFCNLFGMVNEGLVRLPAALFGFGAVMIACMWARGMGRERAGIIAAFMCATSMQYFEYSKVVLTDTTITFMVMLSLYLFWKAYNAGEHQHKLYALFILVSALSFYAKGLLGPGCVWLCVCAFLLYQRRWKLLFVLPLVFLPILILVLAPWTFALWKAGGAEMLKGVFWDNQFGRFLSFTDHNLPPDPFFYHKEPITYYLFHLPARLMPWTLLVPPALVYWFRRGRGPVDTTAVLLRFAFGAIVLILHVSSAKATSYALPLYPILFLMTGVWLDDAVMKQPSKIDQWLIGATFVLIGVALLVPPPVFVAAYLLQWEVIWGAGACTAFVCFGLALLTGIVGPYSAHRLWKKYRNGLRTQLILPLFMVIAALFVLDASFVYPVYDNQRTYVPFANMVQEELGKDRRIGLASPEERDCGQFMFYLGRRVEVVSITNNLADFFYFRGEPAGVIVPTNDLTRVVRYLSIVGTDRASRHPGPYERPFKILKSDHSGYKCRQFVLLLNEEDPLSGNDSEPVGPDRQDGMEGSR